MDEYTRIREFHLSVGHEVVDHEGNDTCARWLEVTTPSGYSFYLHYEFDADGKLTSSGMYE